MSDVLIGQLLGLDASRDAIHVAIAPVVAAEMLDPGDHVGLDHEGQACNDATKIGIVDPFLKNPVKPGERFYLCLYPNTVTGMRHHWQHPQFRESNNPNDKELSMKWMREFASQHYSDNEDYNGFGGFYSAEMLIQHASDYLQTEDRHVQQGSESLRDSMWNDTTRSEFWKHFSVITGIAVADNMDGMVPFCCTC